MSFANIKFWYPDYELQNVGPHPRYPNCLTLRSHISKNIG